MSEAQLNSQLREELMRAFPNGVVAIDLETTGLSPIRDRIVEIGAVKLDSQGEVSTLNSLINPKVKIPQFTINIHSITDEMVADAPLVEDFLPKLTEFFQDCALVAHNACFDFGFILYALHQSEMDLPNCDVYDSIKLARKNIKDVDNFKLKTLCKHFDLTLENHHRAMDDAMACLELTAHCIHKKKLDQSRTHNHGFLYNLKNFDHSCFDQLPEHLDLLRVIVGSEQIIEIEYSGGSHGKKPRPIQPLSILPMPKGPVVHALCCLSGHYKSFALNKIKNVIELEQYKQIKWRNYLSDYSRSSHAK